MHSYIWPGRKYKTRQQKLLRCCCKRKYLQFLHFSPKERKEERKISESDLARRMTTGIKLWMSQSFCCLAQTCIIRCRVFWGGELNLPTAHEVCWHSQEEGKDIFGNLAAQTGAGGKSPSRCLVRWLHPLRYQAGQLDSRGFQVWNSWRSVLQSSHPNSFFHLCARTALKINDRWDFSVTKKTRKRLLACWR